MSTEGKTNAISRKAKSNVDFYDPLQFKRATASTNCGNRTQAKKIMFTVAFIYII